MPPRGQIRQELMDDAHHQLDDHAASRHCPADQMLKDLSETFWWREMDIDVEDYILQCAGCKYDKGGVAGVRGMKAGMTPVPFTGVTGWTGDMTAHGGVTGVAESAMAAEMAFAMRKAEEQVAMDRLG